MSPSVLTEDDDDLLLLDDDDDDDDDDAVVMETSDVSRKRKAVDSAATGDFITAKKQRSSNVTGSTLDQP